jgi:hypothetical protein
MTLMRSHHESPATAISNARQGPLSGALESEKQTLAVVGEAVDQEAGSSLHRGRRGFKFGGLTDAAKQLTHFEGRWF